MTTSRPLIGLASLAVAAVLAATGAIADTYPSKPVKVLTGYPPGGATELIGRVLTDSLTKALGQPFYVEGKPGAAGNVAGEVLANSPPDGYTLYIAGMGIYTVNRELYPDMKFDPAQAFAPITILAQLPILLEVSTKLPVTNFKEFVAYAKQHGANFNHGSPGIGTSPHLVAELLKTKFGFQSTHVPYRGTGPFVQAMTSGELQWAWDTPHSALAMSKNGAVRLLAISTAQRSQLFPDIPTIREAGIADEDWPVWFGLVAPAKTPREIIDRLSGEVARGFKDPEVATRLRNAGYEPTPTTPEDMLKIVARDRARWSEVVRANNIKTE
jgi:tripartite-type tricarboxylate transporter receptor subunit TctC